MNSYIITLSVKVESDKEIEPSDLQDCINDDFPGRVILNENDWNEDVVVFDSFQILGIQKQ